MTTAMPGAPVSRMGARVAALDWPAAEASLDEAGVAVLGGLLDPEECREVAALYDAGEARFRSRVVMARHGFGRGEYKYFATLPPPVAALRRALYARLVPLAFLLAIALGTGLLMLPASRAGEGAAPFLTALFTATSAVCVTGLAVVDTPTYWSGLGQAIIMALFQVGGLGIMSGATLLGLLVARRLRLSTRLVAQAETRSLALGDVGGGRGLKRRADARTLRRPADGCGAVASSPKRRRANSWRRHDA